MLWHEISILNVSTAGYNEMPHLVQRYPATSDIEK
jgi:hypothetical protein